MNIFAVSSDVNECAEVLDDSRLIKMTLETAQLVSTALFHTDPDYYRIRFALGKAYKHCYDNHPCSIWARQSYRNFWWLVNLGKAYCDEYSYRFGKTHASECIFIGMAEPKRDLPHTWCDCSGQFVEDNSNATEVFGAYIECLRNKWMNDKRQPRWTNRIPPWFYDN